VSIKFPDFQVLVSRSDQVPRINREGDQTGAAGRMAPQVSQDFEVRQRRVDHSQAKDKVRRRTEDEQRRQRRDQEGEPKEKEERRPPTRGRRIDLRA
jgi:hypothetical protein